MHWRVAAIVIAGIGSLVAVGAAAPGSGEPVSSAPSSSPESSSPGSSPKSSGPELELSPSSTNFKTVGVSEHRDRTIHILNLGRETVELGDVDVEGDGYEALFDNCSGKRIERNQSCALTVRFTPPSLGTFPGRVGLRAPVELEGTLVGTGVSSVSTSTPHSSTPPPPPTTAAPATEPTVPPQTTTPPIVTPTTVPDHQGKLAEQLRRCEEDAKTAHVRFTPKLEMVVGTSSEVHVVASIGSTTPGPPETGPPTTVVPAILHCQVEATLRGEDFDIDPDAFHPQSGSFLDRPAIDWSWSVTPTSSGRRKLHLQVLPVAQEDELRLPGTPIVFEAEIVVDAAPAVAVGPDRRRHPRRGRVPARHQLRGARRDCDRARRRLAMGPQAAMAVGPPDVEGAGTATPAAPRTGSTMTQLPRRSMSVVAAAAYGRRAAAAVRWRYSMYSSGVQPCSRTSRR